MAPNLKEFRITWELELSACSPEEAAQAAYRLARSHEPVSMSFDVRDLQTGKATVIYLSPTENLSEGETLSRRLSWTNS